MKVNKIILKILLTFSDKKRKSFKKLFSGEKICYTFTKYMPYIAMNKKTTSYFLLKVFLFSCIFAWAIQWYSYFFGDGSTEKKQTSEENSDIFSSAYVSNYASVGVALSTKIWIWMSEGLYNLNDNSFYKAISLVGASKEEKKKIRKNLIEENMIHIRDYLNISRSDLAALLKSSNNREKTLEGFIDQISFRYKNAVLSLASLEKQKAELVAELENISTKIEQEKAKMETHFAATKVDETLRNVDEYFDLRAQYTSAFTDIVFINQFITQYQFLNNYNTGILDTVINNKEAIINQSYVVIPDSGSEYLRPLELIFDEAEIKAKQKTED